MGFPGKRGHEFGWKGRIELEDHHTREHNSESGSELEGPPNCGARPFFTRTFVNARFAEARHALLLCPLAGCVPASKYLGVFVCSVDRYNCVEDPFYRILFTSLLQGVKTCARLPLLPSRHMPFMRGYDGNLNKGGTVAGAANVHAAMPVRPFRGHAPRAVIASPSTEVPEAPNGARPEPEAAPPQAAKLSWARGKG
jgi:hypothetical protein